MYNTNPWPPPHDNLVFRSNFQKTSLRSLMSSTQSLLKNMYFWATWVAWSIRHLTSAQFMISQFMSSSLTSGSVLTAQSRESTSDSVSPSLSVPPLHMLCLCLSLSKIKRNIKKIHIFPENLLSVSIIYPDV